MEKSDDDKTFMKKKGKKHPIKYNPNPSSNLLNEDYLKTIIAKSLGKGYKSLRSNFAPKNKDSPFGDFPKGYVPKEKETFDLVGVDSHQISSNVRNGEDNRIIIFFLLFY